MKGSLIALIAGIGLIVAYLYSKMTTSAVQGGCYPTTFSGPLPQGATRCAGSSQVGTGDISTAKIVASNGQVFNPDQKAAQTQPDVPSGPAIGASGFSYSGAFTTPNAPTAVDPLIVWNPTPPAPPVDTIGDVTGTPSGTTLPNPNGSGSLESASDVTGGGLSPTFWAADAVPPNPLLANGMSGPTLTQ